VIDPVTEDAPTGLADLQRQVQGLWARYGCKQAEEH